MSEDEGWVLETAELAVQLYISPTLINPRNLRAHVMIDKALRGACVTLSASLASERLDTLEYPRDWWQAFRERWFPRWVLRRWPVQMRCHEARAYYPLLALPKEQAAIRFNEVPWTMDTDVERVQGEAR